MIKSQDKLSAKSFQGKDEDLLLLPEKLQKRLLAFQREGVKFALSRDGRCLIADEMGLGKTVQAISVAYLYRQEWPLLIVVPSSLKYPWIEELERWVPELMPEDINLVESKADITGISQSKVTVLGYGLLTTDAKPLLEALNKQRFGVVIVDESHYLKSRNAARTKILVPVIQNAKHAILLTGTPALGRPEELFMQIDALYPRRFGTWSDYAKKYCNAHYKFFGKRRQWDCRGASHLDELHHRLSMIMIRRLKAEVLTQLPAKIRQRIPFDLPKEAGKEASASFEQWERLMRSLDSGESDSENPFTEVMSLITQMYKQTAVAKAGAVKDYIKMMLETEQLKFLVFAHHLCMLQACTEAVIEAKAGYIRIDGSVPSAERIQLVHRFQNDPDTRVAILSIQAAGQGLTLTAASHVVFAELYWNPGHVKQAEDRAHRIGQTSSVHVHYLIAKGTFDMVMWGMLNRKETVTGSTLNGRKDYLKAEEGDKEKWDFLNFAQAWTPSDCAIGDEDDKEGVFFSHFEKDKQHDIRKFFSPTADKDRKRKRTGDSSVAGSPPTQSHDQLGANQSPHNPNPDSAEDFCPQVKRLRQASPLSRRSGGKRSPLTPLSAPCRLSAGLQVPRHSQTWSCGVCTFSNSGLLLRCEMCETPRAQRARSPSASPSPSPSLSVSSPCITLSDSEGDQATSEASGDRPIAITPQTPLTKQSQLSKEDEEERSTLLLQESQTDPSTDNDGSGCNPVDDFLPVYDSLKFCASKNTDRIYVYDQDGLPLNCNFIPLDIRMQNWEDLPPEFSRTENRRHVVRFVHEWSFLTAMKQRMVRKSGQVFSNPILLLDELTHTQRRHSSTKRYLSKQDVAQTSLGAAQREGGTVRIINKDSFPSKRRSITKLLTQADKETEPCSAALEQTECVETGSGSESGYVQALDSGGNPLCLSCQKPSTDHSGWAGGFCSAACMEEFQLRSNQSYMRARVLEAEEGVCQHCGLHAHQLYLRVRDAPHTHRKEILDNTWLAQLPLKQLNEMIRNPVEGQFWQVDHINPVYSGGGQCLLDNLQTLCTVCHRMRTAQQAKERSQMKKGQAASKLASDITRFFTKK
ncbi:DNA annealing helicase and endonuclease ZRANB3 isoform X1 [Pygocentrus nattereri]|uniref:Zinc finger, RAN-binding domain containing 3 n=1 Tax=Pygocentrus nattereri TaxID=42514 RepID=A0A3B4CCU9_PYGNA|nr:DNA annealing helicase and endonuclease ZRANB3 isoform X1 [Pygocentrus nattereri]